MRTLKAIPLKTLADGSCVTLIPEIAYLVQARPDQVTADLDDEAYAGFCQAYETFKHDMYMTTPITHISIVPTGYCEGGCSYCYAKDGWKLKDYMTPAVFDAALARNNVKVVDSVIIYGGEPMLNWDGYTKLIQHLVFEHNVKKISTATSTFFDDETFQKLLSFVDNMDGRLSLSISIDPEGEDGKYLRRYAGKDTYRFIFNRLVELVKHTHNIGIRPTVSKISPDPFKLLREIRAATGFELPCTIDPVKYEEEMAMTPEQHAKLLADATAYIQEHYYSGEVTNVAQMFSPFRMPLEHQNLVSIMKSCDMGTGRLTVMPDGNVADCSESVKLGHPEVYEKNEANFQRTFGFPPACSSCDYKYLCNVSCFQYLSNLAEHTRGQKQYCAFRQHVVVEGIKFWFSKMTDAEALAQVTGQAILGVAVEPTSVAPLA